MKKRIISLICVVLSLVMISAVFYGCSKTPVEKAAKNTALKVSAETVDVKVGETAYVAVYAEYDISGLETYTCDYNIYNKDDVNDLVVYNYKVANSIVPDGEEKITIGKFDFACTDLNGDEYKESIKEPLNKAFSKSDLDEKTISFIESIEKIEGDTKTDTTFDIYAFDGIKAGSSTWTFGEGDTAVKVTINVTD